MALMQRSATAHRHCPARACERVTVSVSRSTSAAVAAASGTTGAAGGGRRHHRAASVVASCAAADNEAAGSSSPPSPPPPSRRGLVASAVLASSAAALAHALRPPAAAEAAAAANYEPMEALKGKDYGKSRFQYPDFTSTPSGLQYKDLREGSGDAPGKGDLIVCDWSGFTIGYYGRPFEARNKPKGGSFTGEDKDFLRFRLGSGDVIPAFDEAVSTMRVGGIRRIVVPVELGYPDGSGFKKVGPRPTTFSGERTLDFVLGNRGMIDKTLLFDIELIRKER